MVIGRFIRWLTKSSLWIEMARSITIFSKTAAELLRRSVRLDMVETYGTIARSFAFAFR